MATIKENFIAFSSDRVYNEHISDVTEDSISFIFKKGEEKLITQGKAFYFVPTNGSVGQVLKKRDGYFSWDDLANAKATDNLTNLSTSLTLVIGKLRNDNNEEKTIAFTSDFKKGESCTIYMTKDREDTNDVVMLINESFVSLNGQYRIVLSEVGKWTSVKFFSDGGTTYVEIGDLGQEEERIRKLIDESYLMKNGMENSTAKTANAVMANETNLTKNQYEFAIGKYNNDTRNTSAEFGVANTLFAVGNGLNSSNKHNAFHILQNGEIEIVDLDSDGSYYEKTMFSLQSKLKEYETSIGQLTTELNDATEKINKLEGLLEQLQSKIDEYHKVEQESEEMEDIESEETKPEENE